jgi:type II secretory pathway component PulF
MAMLLKAGSQVVPALSAIGKQLRGPARELVDRVRQVTEGGQQLAEALSQFPDTFSPIYVAVVGAGEMSASLPEMFARLAVLAERRRELRTRLISAVAYPALLICLSVVIVSVLVAFVVPRFKTLFESLNAPLPFSTRVMFAISLFVRDYWPWVVVVAVTGLLAVVAGLRSRSGRSWLNNVKTRLPGIGRLATRLLQAQMFRVMGLLLESRVGLMETINLTGRISLNKDFQTLCAAMRNELQRGNPLSEALVRSLTVAPPVAQAIATGEQSGHMDQAMLYVADVLDDENTQLINAITKLLEPVILVVMGVFVGGIALSLFIPLFDLASIAQ